MENTIRFIRKIYNEPEGIIPLHVPVFQGNEKKYLLDCVDSTFVSSVGEYVNRIEHDIANYTGANYAVATVNGTAALHIALLMVGVGPGDEVITQSLTFIATANAIKYSGANPIFIDVDRDTLGLSPDHLDQYLKNQTRWDKKSSKIINKMTLKPISACVPMHTFGHPCKIDEIINICNRFNLPVIEDSAESLGSFYKEKHTGTYGKLGIFSFNGNKIITSGGGGIIITDDEVLARQAKHITTTAKLPHPWKYQHDMIGYNYRMPNINAAMACAQLEQIDCFIKNKRLLAEKYKSYFDNTNTKFISEPPNSRSNYWLNTIMFNDVVQRDAFLRYSNENGVMTRPAWSLMTNLHMYHDCEKGDLTNSRFLEERIVNIPSSVTSL